MQKKRKCALPWRKEERQWIKWNHNKKMKHKEGSYLTKCKRKINKSHMAANTLKPLPILSRQRTKALLCLVKGVASLLWNIPRCVAADSTFLRRIAMLWLCTVALPPLRHMAGIHPSIPCSRLGALFWNLLCPLSCVLIGKLHGIDPADEGIGE